VKMGDQDIIWHKNFKLFLTTRIPNPHYTPEVSTKVILVNFTVKQAGLEEQLLGIIVGLESPGHRGAEGRDCAQDRTRTRRS